MKIPGPCAIVVLVVCLHAVRGTVGAPIGVNPSMRIADAFEMTPGDTEGKTLILSACERYLLLTTPSCELSRLDAATGAFIDSVRVMWEGCDALVLTPSGTVLVGAFSGVVTEVDVSAPQWGMRLIRGVDGGVDAQVRSIAVDSVNNVAYVLSATGGGTTYVTSVNITTMAKIRVTSVDGVELSPIYSSASIVDAAHSILSWVGFDVYNGQAIIFQYDTKTLAQLCSMYLPLGYNVRRIVLSLSAGELWAILDNAAANSGVPALVALPSAAACNVSTIYYGRTVPQVPGVTDPWTFAGVDFAYDAPNGRLVLAGGRQVRPPVRVPVGLRALL